MSSNGIFNNFIDVGKVCAGVGRGEEYFEQKQFCKCLILFNTVNIFKQISGTLTLPRSHRELQPPHSYKLTECWNKIILDK